MKYNGDLVISILTIMINLIFKRGVLPHKIKMGNFNTYTQGKRKLVNDCDSYERITVVRIMSKFIKYFLAQKCRCTVLYQM